MSSRVPLAALTASVLFALFAALQAAAGTPSLPSAPRPTVAHSRTGAPAPAAAESPAAPAPAPAAAVAPLPAPPVPPGAARVDPLTDLPVSPERAAAAPRALLAVMVENSTAARPQSGLDRAGIVFETYVEGGVTRFMTLFAETDADVIGPVRSTRQYFASWAFGFGAHLGHCYAKPTGYATIKRLGVMSLDAVRAGAESGYYWRTKTKPGPHNLYASTEALRRYAVEKKKFPAAPATSLWPFKAEAAPGARGAVAPIDVHFSGKAYDARFDYDAATNTYPRSMAGAPHMSGSVKAEAPSAKVLNGALHDPASAVRLAPRNVVALEMKARVDDPELLTLDMTVVGGGRALVFRDGTVLEAAWSRGAETDPLRIVDAGGAPVPMNAGQTWIVVVRDLKAVGYPH